jgi:hypothetical protein
VRSEYHQGHRLKAQVQGGQFASRQHLSTQRRALLAPTRRWKKEPGTGPGPRTPRWVPVEVDAEETGAEEAILAAALDKAGGRDGAALAGLGPGSAPTPQPLPSGDASNAPSPGAGTPSASHPQAAATLAPAQHGSDGDTRPAHPLTNALGSTASPAGGEALKAVAQTRDEVAVAALSGLT